VTPLCWHPGPWPKGALVVHNWRVFRAKGDTTDMPPSKHWEPVDLSRSVGLPHMPRRQWQPGI
jgi:hypothetical protein